MVSVISTRGESPCASACFVQEESIRAQLALFTINNPLNTLCQLKIFLGYTVGIMGVQPNV